MPSSGARRKGGTCLRDFRIFLIQSWRPHLSTLLVFSFISRVLGRLPRYLKWPGEGAQEKHKHFVFSCLLISLYYIHYSDNKQKIKTKQIQTKIPSPTIISQKPTHVSYFSLKNDVPDVGLNVYKHYISNLPRSLRTHHSELRNHWIRQNFPLALDRISSWNYRKLQVVCVQSCPTLCDPMDCSLPGSSIHGVLQARILEWVATSFSRGSSRLRDSTCVSCIGK